MHGEKNNSIIYNSESILQNWVVKPPNKGHSDRKGQTSHKGQANSTLVYTLYRKSPLKREKSPLKGEKITSERGENHLRKGTKSPLKENLKEDKITSERGQPLYKGQID